MEIQMGLLIKNGEIITASDRFVADVWCENETITRIDKDLVAPAGAEVIDATGKYVFPGFIDPHTHIYLPFMGTYAVDDYETGTIAALCGGTTTVMDFCIPGRDETPKSAWATWNSKSEGKACCDYTYHMAVTHFDQAVAAELRELIAKGVSSFKIFLAYAGALGLEDDELYQTLKLAADAGVRVVAHCENACIVCNLQAELLAAGKTGPEFHEASRPAWVEADGTRHFCAMLKATGAQGYIAHLSCAEALRETVEARMNGTHVAVETLIQHLLLDSSYAERPNFEAAKYIMSPPLREKSNQKVLWNALESGLAHTIATDHAPFTTTQKRMGIDDFTKIPNGIPSLEDRVRMFYTHGVATGRIDLNHFVGLLSTHAAKLFGLYPRKGTIQVGSDADLVVYDPTYEGTSSAKTQHSAVDYNVFEGWPVKGRCDMVSVRGNVQVRDGEFVGKKGIGQFLRRERVY